MSQPALKHIIEAALMAAESPMTVNQIVALFDDNEKPEAKLVRDALQELQTDCEQRAVELKEVASGYRFQAKQDYAPWLKKMWEDRPPRYSRALLETLVLIAYRQPITRAEIEEIRGVAVNSQIIKTLAEREWINVVGHRDVPGKPALLGTTKQFLDYFNLKSLSELPTLQEIEDLDVKGRELEKQLELVPDMPAEDESQAGETMSVDDTAENVDADNITEAAAQHAQDIADDVDADAQEMSVEEDVFHDQAQHKVEQHD
jgi:segregation and condensation protein B